MSNSTNSMQVIETYLQQADAHRTSTQWEQALACYQQVVKLQPEHWQSFNAIGDLLLTLEKFEEAVAAYYQSLELNPEFDWAYHNLAVGLSRLGRLEEADFYYEKLARLNPRFWQNHQNNFLVQQQYGDYLFRQKQWEGAIEAYRCAIALKPNNTWNYVNCGRALGQLGEWKEAIDCLRKAIELNPNFAEAYHYLGEALTSFEKQDEAINAFHQAIILQSDLPGVHEQLADTLWEKTLPLQKKVLSLYCQAIKNGSTALPNYYKALALAPSCADLYIDLGDVLLQQNRSSGALAVYTMAFQIEPENVQLHSKIGKVLIEQKFYDDAISHLEQVAKIAPDPSSLYMLGLALEKTKRIEESATTYQHVLQLDAEHPQTNLRLGLVYLEQKQWKNALVLLQRALELNTDELALSELYAGLGRALLEQNNLDEAISYLEKSLSLQPNQWQVLRWLGDAFRKQKNRENAVAAYQQAVVLKPDFPWIHNSLADTLREMGSWEEAEHSYSHVIELEPKHYWAHRHLADVLAKQEKWHEAIEICQKTLQFRPNDVEVQAKLEKFISFQSKQLPENAKRYFEQANQFKQENKFDEAIAHYYEAIKAQPEMADAYHELAIVLQQVGRFDEAISWRIKSIEACPTYKESYHRLMWAQFDNPQLLEKAISCCQMVLKTHRELIAGDKNKSLLALIYSTLGDLLTQQGKTKEAILAYQQSTYSKALGSRPNNPFVKNEWDLTQKSRGPDFFIIGGMRCGSTSLHHYVSHHPQIITPLKKEIHFFGENYTNGIDWYLSHFPPIPEGKNILTGEASPCFAEYGIWDRVFRWFPKLKLIAVLRDPIDRAYSHYNHTIRWHSEFHKFDEAIAADLEEDKQKQLLENGETAYLKIQSDYLRLSLYVYWLKEWLQVFPREQILILQSEHLYENPAAVTQQVFDFLELPECNISSFIHTNKGEYVSLDDSLRERLKRYFQPHNQRLEELLDMKFNWT